MTTRHLGIGLAVGFVGILATAPTAFVYEHPILTIVAVFIFAGMALAITERISR